MTLDHALLLLVALFAVAGAFTGALRQVIKLAGVVAGWLAAAHLAPRLAPWLFGARPLPWQRAAAAVGAFAAAALLVSILGGLLRRAVQGPEGRPGAADRLLGALLGGAKAGLAAWVVLSALALAGGRLHLGRWSFDPRASAAGAFAARHNLVAAADPGAARKVEQLLRLTQDPAARRELLARDPGLRELLEDPRLRTLLEKVGAAGEGARDQARELLEDPAAGPLLERLDPPR